MLRLRLIVFGMLLVMSIVSEYTAAGWGAECGGILSGDNGTITSPNYPQNYWNYARCLWSISVEPGKVIRLTFHQFCLEDLNCVYDWIVIYDNSRTNPLGKKCGYSIPEPIWSNGNQMFVEFHSDLIETAQGFQASWEAG
ncbi:hypothetical protein EGW08_023313, partial [Elysia chlorotica]